MAISSEDKYCSKCGQPLVEGATFCTYCGAKLNIKQKREIKLPKFKFTKKKILLTSGVVVGALLALYFGTNLGAIACANNNNFIAAKKLQVIPWVNSTENQYIQAGYHLQHGDFEDAYNEFNTLYHSNSNYKDVKNLLNQSRYYRAIELAECGQDEAAEDLYYDLKFSKYDEEKVSQVLDAVVKVKYSRIQELYHDEEYMDANTECLFIQKNYSGNGYLHSNDYSFLCRLRMHITNDVAFSDLISVIDFEDAKEVFVCNQACFEIFMVGEWKDTNGNTRLTIEEDGSMTDDLPRMIEQECYYYIEDGKEYVYEEDQEDNAIVDKTFTIISKNTIKVKNAKDGKTYVLYRS